MLELAAIRKDLRVSGLVPDEAVRVVSVERLGDNALTVIYKTSDGRLAERLLSRADEEHLAAADGDAACPWSFTADGDQFKLACEAHRVHLAHLFDPMMAVHTSNVEPLPHQITAVYEAMLPRQPLRFLLADDPGAGKTVMAGLLIRELLMRADVRRVLIVAPGSLVEQWQDEMYEKFGLSFEIFSREKAEQSRSGNLFEDHDLLIVRVDQLARSPELMEKLSLTRWDLAVVDEAHKMSAHRNGSKIGETKRFKVGRLLGDISRHLLLMTATPHNGKNADFALFLSLLDQDRFYHSRLRDDEKIDASDLMRRLVKEKLLKFDGTRLFPERRANTVSYSLSAPETALYEAVTHYVKTEMNRADHLDDNKRKGTVGFALTILQRRLASSPEAIFQSLKRRRLKLQERLDEAQNAPGQPLTLGNSALLGRDADDDDWNDEEDLSAEEYEQLEETVMDSATAARTISELAAEIATLEKLERQAREIRNSREDCKWTQLRELLQNTPEMQDADRRQRKLILFTEHRDTLNYLADRIGAMLGADSVVTIHGSVRREQRRHAQEQFRNDPRVRVLLATDAAGEGVNLQNASLMVNYDLPWNPNRIEQRFGRIHRIGQTEVCHLWNLVARNTREGEVFQRLFEKLEIEHRALGGQVFDILGEVFEEKNLRDLLIEAIRYGDDPAVRQRLREKVENALDEQRLRDLIARHALCEQAMGAEDLFKIRAEMDKAEARKLQPWFVRGFFREAFARLGGELRPRETGRFEIPNVPAAVRERARQLGGRDHRYRQQVVSRYERVCFEKQHLRVAGRANSIEAAFLHPAHPLMQTVTDLTLEHCRPALAQGAVLLAADDDGATPRALFMVEHTVRENQSVSGGGGRVVSRRVQFVAIDADGHAATAGWAPHLDLQPLPAADRQRLAAVLTAPWLAKNLEQQAVAQAAAGFAPEHFDEVRRRREQHVDKTLAAVHERLTKEIHHWEDRALKLKEAADAGLQPRLNYDNAKARMEELDARLHTRTRELAAMRGVVSATPVVLGCALVVPQGLLARLTASGTASPSAPPPPADAAARRRVEQLAMQAVMDAECALGHTVSDVSAEKCGWDITAQPPPNGSVLPPARHIEVKGRAKGQDTVAVSYNEILYALNQGDKYILAIVLADGERVEGPHYIRNPFEKEPDRSTVSVNYDLAELLKKAVTPAETIL